MLKKKARNISIYSDTIIFPSKYVKDEFKDIVDKKILKISLKLYLKVYSIIKREI